MSEMNRRDFLAAATGAVCACAACGLGEALAAETGADSVDVGPLSGFASDGVTDAFARSHRILVVRNDRKLYACSAICTHKKNIVLQIKGDDLWCQKHGSRFSHHGTVTKGPATESLVRYAISVNDKGNVIVDKTKSFREKNWEEPGAFIDLSK